MVSVGEDSGVENESPRKRMYHRITGAIVMAFGSLAAVVAVGFLLH